MDQVHSGKVVVVIPLHKVTYTNYEQISLLQSVRTLSDFDICMLVPSSLLSNDDFLHEMKRLGVLNGKAYFQAFEDHYFESLRGYNRLMLEAEFYRRFLSFEYILIVQPDVFVFSGDLLGFLNDGFDYMGAPWFAGRSRATATSPMLGFAGNGGLSLRKVASFLHVLENGSRRVEKIQDVFPLLGETMWWRKPFRLYKELERFFLYNRVDHFWMHPHFEDFFWAYYVPKMYPEFNVALPEYAMRFSFEYNPSRLYEMNGNKLPFGCHAWWKTDLSFWKKHISLYGYDV